MWWWRWIFYPWERRLSGRMDLAGFGNVGWEDGIFWDSGRISGVDGVRCHLCMTVLKMGCFPVTVKTFVEITQLFDSMM